MISRDDREKATPEPLEKLKEPDSPFFVLGLIFVIAIFSSILSIFLVSLI